MADEPTKNAMPTCDEDTHYWLQGVSPPPDGSRCQCDARVWPVPSLRMCASCGIPLSEHPLLWETCEENRRANAETTDQLLRGMVQQARLNHPLPWRVEHDWGVSVEAATGRVFFGTAEECQRIVALAEQQVNDADAFGKEFEAMMQSDADSARTPQRNPNG